MKIDPTSLRASVRSVFPAPHSPLGTHSSLQSRNPTKTSPGRKDVSLMFSCVFFIVWWKFSIGLRWVGGWGAWNRTLCLKSHQQRAPAQVGPCPLQIHCKLSTLSQGSELSSLQWQAILNSLSKCHCLSYLNDRSLPGRHYMIFLPEFLFRDL